jgi:uncharacterized membrane protein YedE/YeeE
MSTTPGADLPILAVAMGGLTGTALKLAQDGAWSSVALLGWVFLTEAFGYTDAFRAWLTRRDGSGLAAGLLVALVAATVIIPVASLVDGYTGFDAPLELPLLAGAAMFGIGMQLANGCGTGTLYAAGGGSPRMWAALPAFCVGGLLGSLALPAAVTLPTLPPVNLAAWLGPWRALAATWALGLGLIVLVVGRGPRPAALRIRTAIVIGVLASAVFLLAGQPWGVTTGLTLWGAKAAVALGFDVAHTTYWSWEGPRQDLAGSVLRQGSSLMDIGMILGATAAAAWRNKFRAQAWPSGRGLLGAVSGGLMMGIGARLSFGCNIGAMVSGIASGSLHGFVWFFAVLPGCWLGIRVRPWFGLSAS